MLFSPNKPLPRTALEPVCEALAIVILQRREANGLSLNRLAELTRLSRQMISFIETNRRIPTVDTVARISRDVASGWRRKIIISLDHAVHKFSRQGRGAAPSPRPKRNYFFQTFPN